jgi:cytochrome b561
LPRQPQEVTTGSVALPEEPARKPFGRSPELWYALIAIVAVTALYAVAYSQASAFPRASSLIGHGIGIVGFILMLMTATLYSLRKLRDDASWGRTSSWLRFHMVTGLVGPYMVLLHTAMKFNGLAGLAMLLTVIVVISGLVGRYIYTRVPRTVEGLRAATGGAGQDELRGQILRRRKALATWHTAHVPLTWALFAAAFIHVGAALYYATLQR